MYIPNLQRFCILKILDTLRLSYFRTKNQDWQFLPCIFDFYGLKSMFCNDLEYPCQAKQERGKENQINGCLVGSVEVVAKILQGDPSDHDQQNDAVEYDPFPAANHK